MLDLSAREELFAFDSQRLKTRQVAGTVAVYENEHNNHTGRRYELTTFFAPLNTLAFRYTRPGVQGTRFTSRTRVRADNEPRLAKGFWKLI